MAWKELTETEHEALRPWLIDADGLSDASTQYLRAVYPSIARQVLLQLGVEPTQEAVELVAKEVIKQINAELVPALRQIEIGLH
ncbi:MAG: hypothetical protein R3D35_05250 [Nitratireductor sp.]